MSSGGTSHIRILDRLERLYRREQGESVTLESMSETEVRESVRENLTNILNSRSHFISRFNEDTLEHSLLRYGIPDFLGISNSTEAGQAKFKELVEHAIRLYEPRMSNASVEFSWHDKLNNKDVFLWISGNLELDSGTQKVVFRSAVELKSNKIRVDYKQ